MEKNGSKLTDKRYKLVLEQSPASIIITDTDGNIEYVNPKFTEITGYTFEEVYGKNPKILKSHFQSENFYTDLWKTISSGKTWNGEFYNKKKDGSMFWERATIGPVFDDDKTIINYIAIKEDITHLKEIEQELRNQYRITKENEDKYKTLVDLSPNAVIVHSLSSDTILFVNPAAIKMMEADSYEDLIGTNVFDYVHPDSLDIAKKRFNAILQTGKASPATTEKLLTTKGNIISAEVIGKEIKYKNSPAILVVVYDITEKEFLEEQLRQSTKLEAVGRLAGGVAHDFNNLLTVILSKSETLLSNLAVNDPCFNDIEKIYEAGKRAETIVRQLLAFSSRQMLQITNVDMNKIIRNILPLLDSTLREDIELHTNLYNEDLCITADPGQIEQVILNLVINAQDAMPNGGTLTIKTERSDATRQVFLTVADTGIGIKRENLNRLFEPFFTTKEGRSGLGLSIVYGIVSQLGGSVYVESEENNGTDFIVKLPYCIAETKSAEIGIDEITLSGNETILLVEDEEIVRETIESTLSSYGYKVLSESDPVKALELFEKRKDSIDFVLTDVIMPKLNGVELIKKIRKIKPDIKIFFMSGYPYDISSQKGILDIPKHSYEFLSKPVTPTNLLTRIRKKLDRKL